MDSNDSELCKSINDSSYEDIEQYLDNNKLRIRGKSLMDLSDSDLSANGDEGVNGVDEFIVPETDEEDSPHNSAKSNGPDIINSSSESIEEGGFIMPGDNNKDIVIGNNDETALIEESMAIIEENADRFQNELENLTVEMTSIRLDGTKTDNMSIDIPGAPRLNETPKTSAILSPPSTFENIKTPETSTHEPPDTFEYLTTPERETNEASVTNFQYADNPQVPSPTESPLFIPQHGKNSRSLEGREGYDSPPNNYPVRGEDSAGGDYQFSAKDIISKPPPRPLFCEMEKLKKTEERRLQSQVVSSTPILRRKEGHSKPELDFSRIDYEGDGQRLNETSSSVDSLEAMGAFGGPKKKNAVHELTELVESMSVSQIRSKKKGGRNIIESDSESADEYRPAHSESGDESKSSSESDDDFSPPPPSRQTKKEEAREEPRRALLLPFDQLPPPGPAIGLGKLSVSVDPYVKNQVEKTIIKLRDINESAPKPPNVDDYIPPRGLSRSIDLHPHQITGVHWMSWREKCFPYGGILADEMGLGKTLQVLALVLSTIKEDIKEKSKWLSKENRELPESKTTLIVCPASVMKQWEDEISTKAPKLSFYSYHGPSRTKTHYKLMEYDIVLTTYPTIASELSDDTGRGKSAYKIKKISPLVKFAFRRVVLDEGHAIRNGSTNTAKAAYQFTANSNWIVTGTPVHNKPGDVFSLCVFLKLKPFNEKKVWENWIGFDIKKMTTDQHKRLQAITGGIILRRLKTEIQMTSGMSLPTKTVIDVKVKGTDDEMKIYNHLDTFCRAEFKQFLDDKKKEELQRRADQFIAGARMPRNPQARTFTHIFTLILRLKQAAVLPYLIHTMLDEEEEEVDDVTFDEENDLISLKNPTFSPQFKSAKLLRLYEDVEEIRERCAMEDRKMDKIIIVSSWTQLLKVVYGHLKEKKFRICTITGESKFTERHETMMNFNDPSASKQIMLLSLKAGGVGLNLTGANYLFFLDVDWNPQMELQAQDRIHRFGQKKDCIIHRYIHEDTIEDKILEIQKHKLELANGVLNSGAKKGGSGLSIQDMKMIFGL